MFWDDKFDISHKDQASGKTIKYTFKLLKFKNATETKIPEFVYQIQNDSLSLSLNMGIRVCYQMDAKVIIPKPSPINITTISDLCGTFRQVNQEYTLITQNKTLKPKPKHETYMDYVWDFEEPVHSVSIENYAPKLGIDIIKYVKDLILDSCKNCSSKQTSVVDEI